MREDKIAARILMVSSKFPPEYAGSGLRAHRTYKRLADKFNFRYNVLCGSVVFNKPKQYLLEGVSVYRIACKLFRDVRGGRLKKIKNGINYLIEAILTWSFLFRHGSGFDLIHVFGNNHVTAATLSYVKMVKKPLIVEICNEIEKFSQYEPWFLKIIFGRGMPRNSKVICISKRLKKIYMNNDDSADVWCRPNPVDPSKFYIDKKDKIKYKEKLTSFSNSDIVLLNIGKICPLKNQIFLIEVLKDLPEQYKLIIAGPIVNSGPDFKKDTAYFNELKERVKSSRIVDRVKIENRFISNADEYIKAADIYLLPSKIEACATPVLEALACGIPVVAHSIEGVTTEWIKEGINGYLAPLDEGVFRKRVMMAASLNNDRLDRNARKVMTLVSSDAIDREYAGLIKRLLRK